MGCNCCDRDESSGGRVDFQYAVKTVCGNITPSKEPPHPLPPGRYFTAINVHNPSRCDAVTLRWKVAIGLTGTRVGPVSDFGEATLQPDEAIEIDCSDVMMRLEKSDIPLPQYVKGWVVIETPAELDVVAVYGTARAGGEEPVNAFHTERVQPRCLPVCDDYLLDISTGVADWYVKGPAAGATFTQATLKDDPQSPWAAAPAGSMWVTPGNLTNDGNYTYRLRFKLCSGFRKPNLKLNLLADYYANVFLNGHQIPPIQTSTSGPGFTTPIPFSTGSHFKAGDNELIIVVNNTERLSQTGLALHGFLEVENGRCPGDSYPLLVCPTVCYRLYTREFYFNPFIGFFIDINQRWDGPGCQFQPIGEENGKRRAERFEAYLSGTIPPGTFIEYKVFTRNASGGLVGWSNWTSSGPAGVVGSDRAITAIAIRLRHAPVKCNVRYEIATRPRLAKWDTNVTWSGTYQNGQEVGMAGGFAWNYPPIVAVKVKIE